MSRSDYSDYNLQAGILGYNPVETRTEGGFISRVKYKLKLIFFSLVGNFNNVSDHNSNKKIHCSIFQCWENHCETLYSLWNNKPLTMNLQLQEIFVIK